MNLIRELLGLRNLVLQEQNAVTLQTTSDLRPIRPVKDYATPYEDFMTCLQAFRQDLQHEVGNAVGAHLTHHLAKMVWSLLPKQEPSDDQWEYGHSSLYRALLGPRHPSTMYHFQDQIIEVFLYFCFPGQERRQSSPDTSWQRTGPRLFGLIRIRETMRLSSWKRVLLLTLAMEEAFLPPTAADFQQDGRSPYTVLDDIMIIEQGKLTALEDREFSVFGGVENAPQLQLALKRVRPAMPLRSIYWISNRLSNRPG